MSKQVLNQTEIDDLIIQIKEQKAEAEAKLRLQAKNEAFDHFVNSGEVIEEKEYFERFLTIERISQAMNLPDIDFDTSLIVDYEQRLIPCKNSKKNTTNNNQEPI